MSTPTNPRRTETPQERRLQAKLSAFISEARQISENLDPIVKNYELQSSEYLIGICGGIASSLGTYFYLLKYFPALGAAGVTTACALMLLFGIAIAIFLFRGPSRWIADIRKGRMRALDEQMQNDLRAVRQEIKALEEAKAPAYVLSNAWSQYDEAAFEYNRVRIRLIGGGNINRVSTEGGSNNPALRISRDTPPRQLGAADSLTGATPIETSDLAPREDRSGVSLQQDQLPPLRQRGVGDS